MSLVDCSCDCCGERNDLSEISKEWDAYGQTMEYTFILCKECRKDKDEVVGELIRDY